MPFYWVVLQEFESPNTILTLSLVPLLFGVISSIFVYIWTIKDIKENQKIQRLDVISIILGMPSAAAFSFVAIILIYNYDKYL